MATKRHFFGKLLAWRIMAAHCGYTTRRVTKSRHNHYWQAINDGQVVGFFNDPQDGRKAGGELEIQSGN